MREILVGKRKGINTAAIFENGILWEYITESGPEIKKGNIYRAQVIERVKGLDACFAKISKEDCIYIEHTGSILKSGNTAVVQIKGEAVEGKYPSATLKTELVGRYAAVYFSKINEVNISKKITGKESRESLKIFAGKVLDSAKENLSKAGIEAGIIIRTEAESAGEKDVEDEIKSLLDRLCNIYVYGGADGGPELLYRENFWENIFTGKVKKGDRIIAENAGTYAEIYESICKNRAICNFKIKIHLGEYNLFEMYNTDAQIRKYFSRKIWLKSGGYIIIDRTEAMTVIDVNSGKCIKKDSFEDMARTVNFEAADEIAHIIRLKNIGGIVVIDFLKEESSDSENELTEYFKKAVSNDPAAPFVAGMTKLGIMELTRKKL